jgi:hypothetical protein
MNELVDSSAFDLAIGRNLLSEYFGLWAIETPAQPERDGKELPTGWAWSTVGEATIYCLEFCAD